MKTLKFYLLFISILTMFTACNEDEKDEDIVKEVVVTVDSELKEYTPWGSDVPYYGLNIKENGDKDWDVIPIDGIEGFEYQEGFMYKLLTKKTILANPPMDYSNVRYKLIEVIEKNQPTK